MARNMLTMAIEHAQYLCTASTGAYGHENPGFDHRIALISLELLKTVDELQELAKTDDAQYGGD